MRSSITHFVCISVCVLLVTQQQFAGMVLADEAECSEELIAAYLDFLERERDSVVSDAGSRASEADAKLKAVQLELDTKSKWPVLRTRTGKGYSSRQQKESEIAFLKAQVDKLKAEAARADTELKEMMKPVYFPERFIGEPKVGKFGYLNGTVLQVIDETNMLYSSAWPSEYGAPNRTTLWVSGYPTEKLVDNQVVAIRTFVGITKTKSYPTVIGSKSTVFHAEVVNVDRLRKACELRLERKDGVAKPALK